ncbi:MAG TPA: hypothetical protein VFP89_00880 [Propionibacteriaceae bacterium]|nr:hypothetical protein [Propionibacteriaceae bacterium]
MRSTYPPDPPQSGRLIDAHLHLLDRQILDRDEVPVSVVDDLELSELDTPGTIAEGAPPPHITALLSGPVLATRIFGGRPPPSRWRRIPWTLVSQVGITLRLNVGGESLDATWTERWVRDHIIARIWGGRHDPQ